MSWLQPKLHLKVAQKQILTPGLVQMVSVLALNRLELREMITQEMVANPMLEELNDDGPASEDYSEEAFIKAETEKVPETEPANPFDEFDISAFFNQYLDSGSEEGRGERETIERPSFDKFISSPQGLSDHLGWQLSVTVCNETVREIAESMLEVGQQTPILVRQDGERFVLVEGLHRLEACKALGEETIYEARARCKGFMPW